MSNRVIAIGDIHGCAAALAGMIKWIEPVPSDTIVVLGDCVDRGPDSRGVIDQLLALAELCELKPLLGNHEEMMLAAFDRPASQEAWLACGGAETLQSYNVDSADKVPHGHEMFLRTWGDYYETKTHFFAHACYDPSAPLDKQEWGHQRWQSIRSEIPAPHCSGKVAIVGHTSQKDGKVLDAERLVCIDTYCCGGKRLTALDSNTGQIWQVDPQGRAIATPLTRNPKPRKR